MCGRIPDALCASAAAPGRGTELIDSGRITGWMRRLRCVSKVRGPFGVPRRNAERNLHRVVCTAGGVTDTSVRGGTCRFLLVLPSIQTVLSAPDFHRFGLSCGRASLAESWRPVRMRRFVRFLPACESGSRAVTAGSEFHRPRSTMTLLIMPQRGRGAYFLAAGINYVTK